MTLITRINKLYFVLIFICLKYLSIGQVNLLDNSFGDNGILKGSSILDSNHICSEFHYLSDGNFIAAGFIKDGISRKLLVIKMNQEGELIQSFGDDGIAKFDIFFPNFLFDPKIVIYEIDSYYYIWSTKQDSSQYSAYAIKLDNNGSQDFNFGQDGVFRPPIMTNNILTAGSNYEQNSYVIALQCTDSSSSNAWNVTKLKFNSSGQFDTMFGDSGYLSSKYSDTLMTSPDLILHLDSLVILQNRRKEQYYSTQLVVTRSDQIDYILDLDSIVNEFYPNLSRISSTNIDKLNEQYLIIGLGYATGNYKSWCIRLNSDFILDTSFASKGLLLLEYEGFDFTTKQIGFDQNQILFVSEFLSSSTSGNSKISVQLFSHLGDSLYFSDENNIYILEGSKDYVASNIYLNAERKLFIAGYDFSSTSQQLIIFKLDLDKKSSLYTRSNAEFIVLYPNPTSYELRFRNIREAELIENLRIYNNKGLKVLDVPFTNTPVNVSSLSFGEYFIVFDYLGNTYYSSFIKL